MQCIVADITERELLRVYTMHAFVAEGAVILGTWHFPLATRVEACCLTDRLRKNRLNRRMCFSIWRKRGARKDFLQLVRKESFLVPVPGGLRHLKHFEEYEQLKGVRRWHTFS